MSPNSRRSLLQAQILLRLEQGPVRTVSELAEAVDAQRPSVSRSLKTLRNDNLVERRQNGWHLTTTGLDEADRCGQELTRAAEKFQRTYKSIAFGGELMKSNKTIAESLGRDIAPAFTKSLEEASALGSESMKSIRAITESLESDKAPAFTKNFEEALGSKFMKANRAIAESLGRDIAPAFSKSLEEALSMKAPQPLSLMLGERFSESLAPLVDSQRRLSEMMAPSLGLPELGFVMSQNNARIASAIEDIQAVYSAPKIRFQGIESVVYPDLLRDIREISLSYRTLLSGTAEIAAARENVTEMQRTWSRMLNPSSTVSNYTHSLRLEVVREPEASYKSLSPMSDQEDPQEAINLLLTKLSPDLAEKRKGSWQALDGSNPDRLSQAAFSFRELIRMVLDELAPDVEVDISIRGSKRKQQARKILSGREGDFAGAMVEGLPKLYDLLSKAAHTTYRKEVAVRAALMAGDGLLLLLLSSKEDCDA